MCSLVLRINTAKWWQILCQAWFIPFSGYSVIQPHDGIGYRGYNFDTCAIDRISYSTHNAESAVQFKVFHINLIYNLQSWRKVLKGYTAICIIIKMCRNYSQIGTYLHFNVLLVLSKHCFHCQLSTRVQVFTVFTVRELNHLIY